jgi:3-dehydroquinate synthase
VPAQVACGSRTRTLRVNTQSPYNVHIGAGVLSQAGRILKADGLRPSKTLVVTTPVIQALYLRELAKGLDGLSWELATVPDGEVSKSLETVSTLYDTLAERHFGRDSMVLALGGGVVGDTAGFAAATYMRGISFVQAPTTLLAQVDASVGGKVAVDHPRGKNLIGAFHQPSAVVCDLAALDTLPSETYSDGLAEVVKTALIGGEEFLTFVERHAGELMRRDRPALAKVVEDCIALKASIVETDERDLGNRMLLNLGHTFGHAIETSCKYTGVSHGQAVAVGLAMATHLAVLLRLAGAGLFERVTSLLKALGLPVRMADLAAGIVPSEIHRHLAADKKRRQGRVRFIVPRAPGDVIVIEEVPGDILSQVIEAG